MTGTRFRHPAGGPDKTSGGNGRKPAAFTALSRPGYGTICLCYLLTLTVFLSPLALVMAILFADIGPHAFRAHYFYIRTSVGLLVIGAGLGCLMIVLGASFFHNVDFRRIGLCGPDRGPDPGARCHRAFPRAALPASAELPKLFCVNFPKSAVYISRKQKW
ncbi:hypothetical protein QW131_02560 [Roseibium salinum]|nr:hypothetical protein [Roseibium salinum]